MIETIKTFIQNRETEKLINLINEQPEVLSLTDENNSTVFTQIAFSGNDTVLEAAKRLKTSFSFYEAIIAGKDMKSYISANPDLINKHSIEGFTAISLAAFFNHTDAAKQLLAAGADPAIQATNAAKVNALHAAVARGNFELCKLFIENGCDVNIPQMQNVTALHSAAHRGNLELVQLLVENGANINAKMYSGETAIDFAKKDGHEAVVNYLASI